MYIHTIGNCVLNREVVPFEIVPWALSRQIWSFGAGATEAEKAASSSPEEG